MWYKLKSPSFTAAVPRAQRGLSLSAAAPQHSHVSGFCRLQHVRSCAAHWPPMNLRPAWVGLDTPEEASAASALSGGGSFDGVNDHLRRELAARGGESTTLRLAGAAAASVDAYLEYRRIVGDADGGVLFTGVLCCALGLLHALCAWLAARTACVLHCPVRRTLLLGTASAAKRAERVWTPLRFGLDRRGVRELPRRGPR